MYHSPTGGEKRVNQGEFHPEIKRRQSKRLPSEKYLLLEFCIDLISAGHTQNFVEHTRVGFHGVLRKV